MRTQQAQGVAVTKEQLLDLTLTIEVVGKRLHNMAKNQWGDNQYLVEELVDNFDKINYAVYAFQFFSIGLCIIGEILFH